MNLLARLCGGLASRILAVTLALAAAQFPVYYGAYASTVAGARLEAESRLHELEREAAQLQMSVEQFIAHHEASSDAAFVASGRMHRTTLDHYRRYMAMEQALADARPWEKPLVLARNFERPLNDATHFAPAVPLTPEAAICALAGLLLAWMISALLALPFRRQHANA